MKWVRLITVVGLASALGACDWGPRGSGQLTGIVTSGAGPVGAIVLEVSGPGIREFSDAGQNRVFFAERATDVYRVVVVAPNPDQVRFSVGVDDVQGAPLAVVVVEAVDDANAPITDLSGIAVALSR